MDRNRIASLIALVWLSLVSTASAVTGQGVWIAFPNGTTCPNYNTAPINDQTLCYDSVTGWQVFHGSAWVQPNLAGVLCSQLPALTGDTTTSAGSCATTTTKTNGVAFTSAATMTLPVSLANGGRGTNTGIAAMSVLCQNAGSAGNPFLNDNSGASATLQHMLTCSVPANTMGASGVLYYVVRADFLNSAGTHSVTWSLSWGSSTTLITGSVSHGPAAQTDTVDITGEIDNEGTGNQRTNMQVLELGGGGVAAGTLGSVTFGSLNGTLSSGYNTATQDTTTTLTLNIDETRDAALTTLIVKSWTATVYYYKQP